MLWVAGSEFDTCGTPLSLYGEQYRANDIESADTQYLRVTTAEGATITFVSTHAVTDPLGPIIEFVFEKGRIEWEAYTGKPGLVFDASEGAEALAEELRDDNVNEKHLPYLYVCRAIREGGIPPVTIENALQHTQCIDALFSGVPIVQVEKPFLETRVPADDHDPRPLTYIMGIDEVIHRMYAEEISFFESGASWAAAGKEVAVQRLA
jgi:hypothetical protein